MGKQIKSGIICEKEVFTFSPFTNDIKKSESNKLYLCLLHFTALYPYKSRYRISNEFLSWVKVYSPDIIYSQLFNSELTGLVSDLRKTLGLPVAIHIMDDWLVTISEKGLFHSFWQKTIDKRFRRLLSDSKVC